MNMAEESQKKMTDQELSRSPSQLESAPQAPIVNEKQADMKQQNRDYEDGNMSVQYVQSGSDLVNAQLDPAKEKKLLAKLDLYFVPIIMFAYLTCFLDRGNIGMSSFFLGEKMVLG